MMTELDLLKDMLEENEIDGLIIEDLRQVMEHGSIVSRLATAIAKELGKEESFCKDIAIAGMFHDIGKLKLGRFLYGRHKNALDIEEMKYVRMHASLGCDMLKKLNYNDMILSAVYHHHENYDGTGYPDNLKGEQIPLGARILRVCDVFAALTSIRPYREAFDIEAAFDMMIEENKNFDMKIFLVLQRVIHTDDFDKLRQVIWEANRRIIESSRM